MWQDLYDLSLSALSLRRWQKFDPHLITMKSISDIFLRDIVVLTLILHTNKAKALGMADKSPLFYHFFCLLVLALF